MTRTGIRLVRLLALVALVVGLGLVAWRVVLITPSDYEKQLPTAPGAPIPDAASAGLAGTGPAHGPANGTGGGAVPAGCDPQPRPLVGARMTLEGHRRSMPMMSLGVAPDQAPASPPSHPGHTVGWFDRSVPPGAAQGRAVLTSHTFRWGGALGNELNHGLLAPGDVIRISDGGGRDVCYRFTGALKVRVSDYRPDSGLVYDNDGPAQLVIVVCSDYPLVGDAAASRALYYADLVTGP
ncbi:class F sortase [Propionibacterium freudenreichii]|uniref:class F sortase n=1 Tax=Propionibacterium freudenreichii TaxID=1744 RepID=UPI00254A4F7A|nr:class F sortase [Propionibacterium freudenreichii]MDK9341760.1 class F sortase [Propionibacterium freudenreichii]